MVTIDLNTAGLLQNCLMIGSCRAVKTFIRTVQLNTTECRAGKLVYFKGVSL